MKEENLKGLHSIYFILHSGKRKTIKTLKGLVVARNLGKEEGWTGRVQRIFSHEIILYTATVIDTCDYTFIKIYSMYNTQSELWCEAWALGDMTCQCRSMNCNGYTFLEGGIANRGAVHKSAPGVYESL